MKYFALVASLFALLLLNPGSLFAAPAPVVGVTAGANTTTSAYCADTEEMAFLSQINTYRAQNNLPALVLSQTLSAAAYHHSSDMAINNYFSHTLFNGTTWSTNIRNHSYSYATYLAENIAAGNSTATATMTQWKNSAGHNANMLSANYGAIGIARAYSSAATYGWYWTTTFGGTKDAVAAACSTTTVSGTPAPIAATTPAPTVASTARVSALVVSKSTSLSVTTITYTVTVKDSAAKLVSGATVTLSVTTPKGTVTKLTGKTSSQGVIKLAVKASSGPGSYVGKVTGITATGKTYDPTKNAITSVAITI